MPEIEIHPATMDDLKLFAGMDHSYETVYVWQMDRLVEEGQIFLNYREVRLPRPVRVDYPRSPKLLLGEYPVRCMVLTASIGHHPVGYISLSDQFVPHSAWITDLAVHPEHRRTGIGTALVLAAQEWSAEKRFRRLVIEMQSKNYPAIQLARRLGFEFCGYNDHYYSNQDIALFFGRFLK